MRAVSAPKRGSSFARSPARSTPYPLVSFRCQAKKLYSSSFQPTMSGLSREIAGAVGSKGWFGSVTPSTTGPNPPAGAGRLPSAVAGRCVWSGGTGGHCVWSASRSAALSSRSRRHSLGASFARSSRSAVVSAATSRVVMWMPGPLSIDALLKYGAALGIA